ncbi:hypothetical protein G3N95_26100 [Paraburkholderia sp. Tr-20389]|uniref:hypothetical protein n=1 Tax=Paraburkholderia sp. Tr-20389 TaxID=2703903 RepID=UPI00197E48BB|nr:hypothetical protein [Paraburkholderia sp. Tr-20389]MBN3756439.1 hypothetical protein [Paraburkholderia sp. Tr-20389]
MQQIVRSLRWNIDKWFGPACRDRIIVTRAQGARWGARYVCVREKDSGNEIALFLFRHMDGSWSVFPPDRIRPSFTVQLRESGDSD